MRSLIDSKINMLRTCAKTHTDNTARFDVVPAIKANFITFNDYLTKIETWLNVALADAKLAAKQASTRKLALCKAAEKVAMPTGAYAAAFDNTDLKDTMNVRASSLQREKKDRLPTICKKIYVDANAVKSEAAPFNLTEDLLLDLNDKTAAYELVVESPRIAHALVKSGNEEINKVIKDADTLLVTQLDRLVSTLEATDPTLVSLWKSARKLVNPPRKVTQFLLTVLNTEKEPIEDAKSVLRNGKDYDAYTDESGKALYKPAPPGEVALEVMAEGYLPFLRKKMKLKLGAENSLEVLLEKAA
jgi:hypothetical protein